MTRERAVDSRLLRALEPTLAKVMVFPAPEKFITFIKFINFNVSLPPAPSVGAWFKMPIVSEGIGEGEDYAHLPRR